MLNLFSLSIDDEDQVLYREVLRIAIPAIAQSILRTLIFLIDRAMLGYYSTDALAAMQINGPLLWSIFSLLSAFSIGTVALVGRAVGAGDRPLASAAARASLFLAITIGILSAFGSHLGLDSILSLFPAAGETIQGLSRTYLSILFPVVPLGLLATIASAIFQASGDTRTPFLVALFTNLVNVGINYCLIFGNGGAPRLGIAGAAIGTAIALFLNALILLLILANPKHPITFRGWGGEWQALQRIWRVSQSAFGEKFIQHLGYLGFITLIGALGGVAMAANEAVISIESICFESADGIGIAAAAIVAQQLGAGRSLAAAKGARAAAYLALSLLSLCGVLFILCPRLLLTAFTPDPRILTAGIPSLGIAAVAQPFMAVSLVLTETLRGAGDTRTALYISLAGWFCVRLIATYAFAFGLNLGLVGVWLGSTSDWFVRAVVLIIVLRRGKWREIKV